MIKRTETRPIHVGGLQIGGGITAKNASLFLEKGASHVIVTTYLFRDGEFSVERLFKLALKLSAVEERAVKEQVGLRY